MSSEALTDGFALTESQTPRVEVPSGVGIARSSIFNLLGQGIPLLAAFLAIPVLVHGLGTNRFGVLTLVWMVIGYFSLFDLGLSRALTQAVSARLGRGYQTQAPPLVWPALTTMFGLGVVGACIVGVLAPWLVYAVLKIPAALQNETVHAFYWLAAAIPVVVVTSGLIGILGAYHRFGILNVIRAPMGIFTFLAPVAVLPFSRSLAAITATLALGRVIVFAAHLLACRQLLPEIRVGFSASRAELPALFRFGAWMSVSNVIGPLMLYLDRFVIGASLSVAAVAYYATPYEMVTKLLIIPSAVLGVLFPAFAASYVRDHDGTMRLLARGTKYISFILLPALLLIAAFAHEALHWWLGEEFASHSTMVLQTLAVGVFINAAAQIFATLVQGVGRPDLTAKLHVLELPVYLIGLWWAIQHYGIAGAAIAWTGRVALDGILLFWLMRRFVGGQQRLYYRMMRGLLLALAVLSLPLYFDDLQVRMVIVAATLIALVPGVWFLALNENERRIVMKLGRGKRYARG